MRASYYAWSPPSYYLWNDMDIPDAWENSRLKTFWKGKGSKKDPSKQRGLSIGSTLCKLILNIILKRLWPWYEAQLADEQNGYQKYRGTDQLKEFNRSQIAKNNLFIYYSLICMLLSTISTGNGFLKPSNSDFLQIKILNYLTS